MILRGPVFRAALASCALVGCSDVSDDDFVPIRIVRGALPPGYGDGLMGRSFTIGRTHHVLADLQHVALELRFDVASARTHAHAELQFRPVETGVPFFVFTPAATAAKLDGAPIELARLTDPDKLITLTSMATVLEGGSDHLLAFDYELSSAAYSPGGVDFLQFLEDASGESFEPRFQRYVYGSTSTPAM